ncbi:hypothetical protein L218DRAFT_881930, partial [Marasmius fiardii PR-910]
DLAVYQTEINKLKVAIHLLETRRDALSVSVARYRSLLSPIYRMPTEILTHIFSFCCDENVISPGYGPPAVMTLSAVCESWREVALTTPRLWSCMSIKEG